METQIKFGTDGWRGMIADDYTFANVRRCAQGFANYLLSKGGTERGVVIGHDKRFDSEYFAQAAAEVLAANGIKVFLTDGATPTPVISFSVPSRRAIGAVNITASHNPGTDNGFKVRNETGGAIDPAGLKEIEACIPGTDGVKRMGFDDARSDGLIEVFDPAPAYLEHVLTDLIDVEPIKAAGYHVLVDCMWGNGASWFPRILEGGRTQITEFHNIRNPIFPDMLRPEPIPPNVDPGLQKTVEIGANVDIITDGDADRLGVGDEHGEFINQLRVYALVALYLIEIRGLRGPIVKTISTTSMLNKLGKMYHVPVYETGVGFKYVAPKMLETRAMVGGEESGGYAFGNHIPERDGIVAGLYMLDFMVRSGKTPSQLVDYLFSKVGPHYYERIDTTYPLEKRAEIMDRIRNVHPATLGGERVTGLDTTDGFKFNLEDGGWLLIRFSGTEPIIRVYDETTHEDRVQPILEDGVKLLGLDQYRE